MTDYDVDAALAKAAKEAEKSPTDKVLAFIVRWALKLGFVGLTVLFFIWTWAKVVSYLF
jgi:hypothetical protein